MEISGQDIFISKTISQNDIEYVKYMITNYWSEGVFETNDGYYGSIHNLDLDYGEFLFYRSLAAKEAIEEKGLTSDLENDLMSIVIEPKGITFVFGNYDEKTKRVVNQTVNKISRG